MVDINLTNIKNSIVLSKDNITLLKRSKKKESENGGFQPLKKQQTNVVQQYGFPNAKSGIKPVTKYFGVKTKTKKSGVKTVRQVIRLPHGFHEASQTRR
jgi:hypothetical protein